MMLLSTLVWNGLTAGAQMNKADSLAQLIDHRAANDRAANDVSRPT
jgi:hypothetical protein